MSFNFEHDDAIRSMLRRARVLKVYDDGTQQKLDLGVLKKERPEKIVRVLPHGFSSNPNAEAEGILLQLGGRSDRSLFFGGEHKDYRQKNLKTGQAVLYDDKGNVVFAKGADGLAVHAKEGKVYVQPGSGKNVYLGGDGTDGSYAKVMTESGPSANVYAKL